MHRNSFDWTSSSERLVTVTDSNMYDMLYRFLVNIALPDDDGSQFFQILSTIKFPLLDIKTINKVSSMPINEHSIVERLTPIRPYFLFNPNLLSSFLSYLTDDIARKPSSTIILYYIVISWLGKQDILEVISCFQDMILTVEKFKQIINQPLYNYILNQICSRYFENPSQPFPSDLIETIFTEINQYNFEFASEVLNKSVMSRASDSFLYLTNLFNSCLSSNPEKFADLDYQILISTLYQYMTEFDETSLSIISTLGTIKENQYLTEAIKDLPSIICHKIQPKCESFAQPSEEEFIQIDIDCKTKEFSFSPDQTDLFPNGIDEISTSVYETNLSFDELLSNEDKKILRSIIAFLSRMHDCYSDVFFDSFVEVVDNSSFIIFLYILAYIRKVRISDKIFVKLFVVFQPGITVFKPPENINFINFYRKTVLNILSIHAPITIGKLLILNEEHPLLLADIIGRINNKLSVYDLTILTDDNILGTIIRVNSMLTQLILKGIEVEASRKAIVTIIYYIFAILENKFAAARCFLSPIFASGFLSRVLEPSMQKPIINALHTFLTEYSNTDVTLLQPLVEFICGILGVCRSLPKTDRLSSIVVDILNCVNDSLAHNTAIINCFSPILLPATYFLVENSSKDLLREVLYLSTLLVDETKKFHISYETATLLSAVTRAAESEIVSDTTICGLLTILANSRAASPKVMFLIKEYNMINVLISVLKDEKQFIEIIDLFQQLCKHSLHNCRMCHNGELDLLLLEIIKNHGKEFTFRGIKYSVTISKENVVNVILPMITTISSFVSSPQVVMSLLSVISPSSDRTFSDFAVSAMKEIGSTLSLVMQSPKLITPLGDPFTYLDIKGVTNKHIHGGFTLQFYIQNDVPAALMSTRCPQIIQINDTGDLIFRLHLSGNSIICNIWSANGLSYAALASNLPSCTWFVATIAVNIAGKDSNVSFYVNGKQVNSYSVNLYNFHEGNLGIKIGGVSQNDDDSLFDCRLGDVWFFGECFDKRTISELNMIGARASDVGSYAIFSYPKSIIASGVNIKLNKGPNCSQSSILDMFTQRITDLVPFFDYMDTMPNHFPPQLIDLIQCIIPSLTESDTDIFHLIANLLLNAPYSKLTYGLYQKFFAVIEKINCSKITESLISNILFNPELWCCSEPKELTRIVSHWSNSLFTSSPSIFMRVVPISTVLAVMRMYFYYQPIEIEIIRAFNTRKRPQNLDIEFCRQNLSRLVYSMSLFKFTTKDAISIISHCSTCADTQQSINLMSLLTDICKNNKIDFPPHVSKLVYHQMKPNSEERFVTAVKLLYTMNTKDFYLVHINAIVSLLAGNYITEKLYENLLQIFSSHHLIYPLLIIIANTLYKSDEFAEQIKEIEFSYEEANLMIQHDLWCFWLILLVVNGENKTKQIVTDIIVKILFVNPQINFIDDILIIIDLFANITDFGIEEFGRNLCEKIVPLVGSIDSSKLHALFIKRCIKYLFFRINGPNTTDALQNLFELSPFSLFDVTNSVSQFIRYQRLLNIEDIREAFANLPIQDYKFMLRIDDNSLIQDKDLFAATMALLQNLPILDDDMKFWVKYFTFLNEKNRRNPQFIQELDDYLPAFYESMNKQFQIGLHNFKSIINKNLETGKVQCVTSLLSLKTRDIGLSSFDIDIYTQQINISEHTANRQIRRYSRQNSYMSQPWSGLTKTKILSRSFSYCPSLSQPIMKIPSSKNYLNGDKIKILPENDDVKQFNCLHVRVKGDETCVFQIWPDRVMLIKIDKVIQIPMKEVLCVLVRNRLHRSNSIEIFYADQKSILIDFTPVLLSDVLPHFMRYQVRSVQSVSMQNYFPQLSFTKMWINREMSNFEYLIRLNLFTGRTYHDMSLYPIFPWVCLDFDSEKLDFNNPSIFRDFTKSIVDQNGFMYMTSPSNPSVVKYFLGKVSPFDVSFEKTKFDLGKFESLKQTIEKIKEGMNSVEITPEFFLSPEYFTGIELPKWAKNEFEFVYYNRKLLESEYVSQNLNNWIDLIFGYKQKGYKGTNIYNPVLFEDVWQNWTDTNSDIIMNTLKTAGHMPPMIFNQPHPQRNIFVKNTSLTVPFNYTLERSDMISVSLVYTSSEMLTYIALCNDGDLIKFTVNIETPQKSNTFLYNTKIPVKENHLFAALKLLRSLAVVDEEKGQIYIINEKVIEEYNVGAFNMRHSASDQNSILICSRQGEMNLFKTSSPQLKQLAGVFSDYAVTVTLSEGYSIYVCAMKNGSVICNSFTNSFLWSTDIENVAKKLLITRLWGFILCQCQKELVLLSVNGKIINRCDIDFIVSCWCCWDENGADYIAIADDKGRIRVFEAFTLELSDIIFNCRCQVLSINYVKEMSVFSIITQDGHCRLLPRDICANI